MLVRRNLLGNDPASRDRPCFPSCGARRLTFSLSRCWSHYSLFQQDQLCMRTVKLLLSTFPPLQPGSRTCPMLRRLRPHLKAPRRTSLSCRRGLTSLTNQWTLETSSNTWWSPRLDLAAFSPMVSLLGYAWRILPTITPMYGAREQRHLGETTETPLPVPEPKVLAASLLLF